MLETITNTPRDYAWGSHTLLAGLEGRPASDAPEAEVWFGDHPGSPAVLPDGETLPELEDRLGLPHLPYLLKLLAAQTPLSIQVHPTLEQARVGFAAEADLAADSPERNYRDANHKPELIVALSDRFEALCGLRPVSDTRRLLDVLGGPDAFAQLRAHLSGSDDAQALSQTIGWLLSGAAADTVAEVSAALAAADAEGEYAGTVSAGARIAALYAGDPGIVVALLMNHVVLTRGQAVYLRAGLLHAYLSGLGVEIMAASDNVLRGGLTPKRVDVAELLSLLDSEPGPVAIREAVPDPTSPGVLTYGPGVGDFALAVARPDGGSLTFDGAGPTIFLATAGKVSIAADDHRVDLVPGGAAILLDEPGAVRIAGAGEVFIATPGSDRSQRGRSA
ncbi:mannose-6-phosphate isomerase, class I [Microbacterium gorillae]|uniref:mannose-6-phosphate isomerase, class I n=1 Tax=Microbacterium gorillae TaxID=1231063 RepID=UPI00058D55B9|nr:mannose-6-phosphate isomerase, class I [Microbacterium gorillae]